MTGIPASAAGGSSGARGAASTPGASGASGRSASTPAKRPAGASVAKSVSRPDGPDAPGGSGPADGQEGARPARGGKLTAAAVNQASVWNVANLLTMLRLLLVPGFVALMLADGGYDPAWRSLAWAAFAIAMITDLFDGHLARTYNLVTDFGKIATPSPTRRSWVRR